MNKGCRLKAELLSYGVRMSDEAIRRFSAPYLVKRRAYSNTDSEEFLAIDTPQEIIIMPEGIVVGVTLNHTSPLCIDWADGRFFLRSAEGTADWLSDITFTLRPSFYGMELTGGIRAESVLTYIFGHTLGIFVNTSCYFATPKRHCRYCSILANPARPKDNVRVLDADLVAEAVRLALMHDDGLVSSIFISGGNFSDFDESFLRYADIAKKTMAAVQSVGRSVRVMLSVFPPKDLSLLSVLQGTGLDILLGTEAFGPEAYARFCPGKSAVLTKERFEEALTCALAVLGRGHVYSIAIHGLEEDEALLSGVRHYAELGVCTIVNVLHKDPGTEINDMGVDIPAPASILRVAGEVARIYHDYGFDSSVAYGGRSSFDAECSRLLPKDFQEV